MLLKKLPIYDAFIEEENEGVMAVSLVNSPAVNSFFQAYKEKKEVKFTIDRDNRMVIAPIMRADYPIYRNDVNLGEYYIKYDKKEVMKMAKKMLKDNTFNNINIEHSKDYKDGVILTQLFIKNTSKGISPIGFEDVEEGSLFGVYNIENDEVWEKVENGEFRGVSIEGMFTIGKVEDEDEEEILNDILDMIKSAIK